MPSPAPEERNHYEERVAPLEMRVEDDGEGQLVLRGSAAVFNQRSVDLGGFVEVIERGFFREVLDSDVVALWEHDSAFVLGRTTAEPATLKLAESASALESEIHPADNSRNRDWVLTPIERGEVRHMSFAFRTAPGGDKWEELPDGRFLRTLLPGGCAALRDVSPVTRPAYLGTNVALAQRSLSEWRQRQQEAEEKPKIAALETEALRLQAGALARLEVPK